MSGKKKVLIVAVFPLLLIVITMVNLWWIIGLIVLGGGVVAFRDKLKNLLKRQKFGAVSSPVPTRSTYDIVDALESKLYEEGLIDKPDLYLLDDKAKEVFLKEILKLLDGHGIPAEKKEKLLDLYKNWQSHPVIKDLLTKASRISESFKLELKSKKAEDLSMPTLLSRYGISTDNAAEAVEILLRKLIEDGVSSAKKVIKVKMEFLEKDEDESLIEERLKGIKEKIEEELNYGKKS